MQKAYYLYVLLKIPKRRLQPHESRTPCILGAILDPRVKKAPFGTAEDRKAATQLLVNELTGMLNAEKKDAPTQQLINDNLSQRSRL